MEQISIKTPYPKCRLYWCLIEFIDRIYSQSCWYFQPLLWTSAPLTFSLVHLPLFRYLVHGCNYCRYLAVITSRHQLLMPSCLSTIHPCSHLRGCHHRRRRQSCRCEEAPPIYFLWLAWRGEVWFIWRVYECISPPIRIFPIPSSLHIFLILFSFLSF